jgi:hypothetical protein
VEGAGVEQEWGWRGRWWGFLTGLAQAQGKEAKVKVTGPKAERSHWQFWGLFTAAADTKQA